MLIKGPCKVREINMATADMLCREIAPLLAQRPAEKIAVRNYVHEGKQPKCSDRAENCPNNNKCCVAYFMYSGLDAWRNGGATLAGEDYFKATYCLTKCPKPCAGMKKFREHIEES